MWRDVEGMSRHWPSWDLRRKQRKKIQGHYRGSRLQEKLAGLQFEWEFEGKTEILYSKEKEEEGFEREAERSDLVSGVGLGLGFGKIESSQLNKKKKIRKIKGREKL